MVAFIPVIGSLSKPVVSPHGKERSHAARGKELFVVGFGEGTELTDKKGFPGLGCDLRVVGHAGDIFADMVRMDAQQIERGGALADRDLLGLGIGVSRPDLADGQ